MSNSELLAGMTSAVNNADVMTGIELSKLFMRAIYALQKCEWNTDMESAPSKRLLLAWNKSFYTGRKRGSKWVADGDSKLMRIAGQPHAWREITLPEETQ